MNPYLILGVSQDADDPQIRQAYLEAVKAAPPDVNPARFQEVSAAYELIKDETSRLRHYAFNTTVPGDSPLDAFVLRARARGQFQPMPFEMLKELLQSCSKI